MKHSNLYEKLPQYEAILNGWSDLKNHYILRTIIIKCKICLIYVYLNEYCFLNLFQLRTIIADTVNFLICFIADMKNINEWDTHKVLSLLLLFKNPIQ